MLKKISATETEDYICLSVHFGGVKSDAVEPAFETNLMSELSNFGSVHFRLKSPTVSESLRIYRMNTSFLDGQGLVKPHWLR